ncbi:MAG: RAMP superfamily CRISPR-associated protein [Ignavibacteria bacterium]|nr:RAMP superfamily CRISPR-associated protein [Ignavibacteria bacterium]
MRTYLFEGIVTALTSISHGGGEINSTVSQLRREKIVQPDGNIEEVPVISGNSVRGVLRDLGMYHMLQSLGYGTPDEKGIIQGLPLPAFYFLFSGGSLTSSGDVGIDIEYFRRLRQLIPLISIFGGAIGNVIMPGKLKVGKLIPICKETIHLMPEKYQINCESIWEYCQQEMYTRTDDEKRDDLRGMIENKTLMLLDEGVRKTDITKSGPQQMMYYVETLAAGTKFYWKITLEDVNDIEFESFLITLVEFSKTGKIGGKSNIGLGRVGIKFEKWIEINSCLYLDGKELDFRLGEKYLQFLEKNKEEIIKELEKMQ